MARIFVLVEDEQGRQTGRGESFQALMDYLLRDAGPEAWRGTHNLVMPIEWVAHECDHTYRTRHLDPLRKGPKTQRPVLHAVLAWHATDLKWLDAAHIDATMREAIAHMGLAEHQAAWVVHTDTGTPHAHLVASVVHPETGNIARLGLIKKRMSKFCGAYEQKIGDVRCVKRFQARAGGERRARLPKALLNRALPAKQKADTWPASRP